MGRVPRMGPEEGGLTIKSAKRYSSRAELFAMLKETHTKIQLFFVSQEAVDSGVSEMPSYVPPVLSMMRTHQVVSLAHGELIHRGVSCLCMTTQNLNCGCLNAKHFKCSNKKTAPMASTETEVKVLKFLANGVC